MTRAERVALGTLGAELLVLFGLVSLLRRPAARSVVSAPPLPEPPGSVSLFAADPEPLAPDTHDAWELSPAARAAVQGAPSLSYVPGGTWDRAACADRLTDHARAVARLIRDVFPWVRTIGGIRCSPIGDRLSLHAVGRALDVMTPSPLGSREGEQLANWAIVSAEALGLQLVIWNRRVWQSNLRPDRRFASYSGSSEHRDHVHIEVRT